MAAADRPSAFVSTQTLEMSSFDSFGGLMFEPNRVSKDGPRSFGGFGNDLLTCFQKKR